MSQRRNVHSCSSHVLTHACSTGDFPRLGCHSTCIKYQFAEPPDSRNHGQNVRTNAEGDFLLMRIDLVWKRMQAQRWTQSAAEFYNFEFQLILTYRNKYELCNFDQTHMHRLRRDTSKRGADALPPSCAADARDPRQRATSGFVKLSLVCI